MWKVVWCPLLDLGAEPATAASCARKAGPKLRGDAFAAHPGVSNFLFGWREQAGASPYAKWTAWPPSCRAFFRHACFRPPRALLPADHSSNIFVTPSTHSHSPSREVQAPQASAGAASMCRLHVAYMHGRAEAFGPLQTPAQQGGGTPASRSGALRSPASWRRPWNGPPSNWLPCTCC